MRPRTGHARMCLVARLIEREALNQVRLDYWRAEVRALAALLGGTVGLCVASGWFAARGLIHGQREPLAGFLYALALAASVVVIAYEFIVYVGPLRAALRSRAYALARRETLRRRMTLVLTAGLTDEAEPTE